ncbi:MAG: ABC transporter substrate-binding protein [Polyangiaceae bacterium]
MRLFFTLMIALAVLGCSRKSAPGAAASKGSSIKIGVLTDLSGLYADLAGPGSLVAAKMAVEDFGGSVNGVPVEIVSGDHQNKADIGSTLARQWIDVDGVQAIVDVPSSAVALAVNDLVRDKNKVLLASGAGTSDLTGKSCTPNMVHWTYDTWALANGTGKAVVQEGGTSWFFLTADYAFGQSLEKDVSAIVKSNGGTVLGGVRHPLNAPDFSSFLLQAQSSKAKVVGLANAGGDTINAIKQSSEFGIVRGGQKMAGLLVFISDVHALGLKSAQGLQLTSAFYWDHDERTRAWSTRFAEKRNGKMPTMVQAGVYASVTHYLKAAAAVKDPTDGRAVVAKMKELPTDDPLFGKGTIRADGRTIHPMYLYEVKSPEESKKPWDYYKLRREIPAAEAFRPLAESECPLVKK